MRQVIPKTSACKTSACRTPSHKTPAHKKALHQAGRRLGLRLAGKIIARFHHSGCRIEREHRDIAAENAADLILCGGAALRLKGRTREEVASYTGAAFAAFTESFEAFAFSAGAHAFLN